MAIASAISSPIRSYVVAAGSIRGSASWVTSWLPRVSTSSRWLGSTSASPAVKVPVIAPPAAMTWSVSALTCAGSAPGIARTATAWPSRPLA